MNILIFDSGIGGVSIYNAIKNKFPTLNYHYIFDNLNAPYGLLSEEQLRSTCNKIIEDYVDYFNADILIVACNTVSTLMLNELKGKLNIPVVGVLPEIELSVRKSKNKKIGLLATNATVERPYVKSLIDDVPSDYKVISFPASELTILAEDKFCYEKINEIALKRKLTPIIESNIDTLVLGCTHFPIIQNEIQKILGDNVLLINSENTTSEYVDSILSNFDYIQTTIPKSYAWHTSESIDCQLKRKLLELGFVNVNTCPYILKPLKPLKPLKTLKKLNKNSRF